MTVKVRLFAAMAEQAGQPTTELNLPSGTTLVQGIALLRQKFPKIIWPAKVMVAVNQQYAPLTQELREGDEIAVIPPVSGGWRTFGGER